MTIYIHPSCAVTRYITDGAADIRKGSNLTEAEEAAAWERYGYDQPPCNSCGKDRWDCDCSPDEEGRFHHKDVAVARVYLARLRKIHGR